MKNSQNDAKQTHFLQKIYLPPARFSMISQIDENPSFQKPQTTLLLNSLIQLALNHIKLTIFMDSEFTYTVPAKQENSSFHVQKKRATFPKMENYLESVHSIWPFHNVN